MNFIYGTSLVVDKSNPAVVPVNPKWDSIANPLIQQYLIKNKIPIDTALVYDSWNNKHIHEFAKKSSNRIHQKVSPLQLLDPAGNYKKVAQQDLKTFVLSYVNRDCVSKIVKECLSNPAKYDELLMQNLERAEEMYMLDRVDGKKPVDLLMIHHPYGLPSLGQYYDADLLCWKILIDLKARGYAAAIGVSNFSSQGISNLIANTNVKPQCNQFELHLLNQRTSLASFCRKEGIPVQAYMYLMGGHPYYLQNPLLTKLAAKYNVSVPTILMIVAKKLKITVISTTSDIAQLTELNEAQKLNVQITAQELMQIAQLNRSLSGYHQLGVYGMHEPLAHFYDWNARDMVNLMYSESVCCNKLYEHIQRQFGHKYYEDLI